MRINLALLAAILFTGCSNEQVYNSVQANQRLECGKLPESQFEECMRDANTSYKDYEREVKEDGDRQ